MAKTTPTKTAAGKGVATTKGASKELAKKDDQLPASISGMEQHARAGMENTDRDSFAIPFLAIMQKGSPQVDKDQEVYVEGAEVGDLMLTTSQELFKDGDGANIIFCGYRRVFLRWAPRDSGGGFKGEMAVDAVAQGRANGSIKEVEGKLFADNGDLIRDTRIHYILVESETGVWVPAVLSVASTQIKKSKMLMTQLDTYIAKGANGPFTPPSFAHIFHAETLAESNDQGNWRGWKFSRVGFVEDQNVFDQAALFNESVRGNTVKVDYAQAEGAAAGDGAQSGEGF
jgi:hypothetical protein